MSTSAPNAVTQFLAIAAAALPANFQVRFGAVFGPRVDKQALLVTGVHFTNDDFAELGPDYRHEEHYALACSLCSFAGGPDETNAATRMSEVFNLYADISVAVANNPTLNGTVRVAQTRQLEYSPTADAQGRSVGVLSFEVLCQQRVSSLT